MIKKVHYERKVIFLYPYKSTIQYTPVARSGACYDNDLETKKRRETDPQKLIEPSSSPCYSFGVKALRSELEEINFLLYQISQETGLVMMPIEIYSSGYRYADPPQNGPYEIVTKGPVLGLPHCNYPYAFFSYDHKDDRWYNEFLQSRMMSMLKHHYVERKEYIETCQKIYEHYPRVQKHSYVHFGFHGISLLITLQEMAKYQILITDRLSDANLSEGYVHFYYPWSDRAEVNFDSRLRFLDWKIGEHEQNGVEIKRFVGFQRQFHWFSNWEQQHLILNDP